MSDYFELLRGGEAEQADRKQSAALLDMLAEEARRLLTEAAHPSVVDAVVAEACAALDSDPDTRGNRPDVMLTALRALRVVAYPPRGSRPPGQDMSLRDAVEIVAHSLLRHALLRVRRDDPTDPAQLLTAAAAPTTQGP